MQIKYNCEKCNKEVEVEIKVPKFCGADCRLAALRDKRKKKVIEQTNGEQPTIEPTPEPVPETSAADNPGQPIAGENPVETPPVPAENPGTVEGQA